MVAATLLSISRLQPCSQPRSSPIIGMVVGITYQKHTLGYIMTFLQHTTNSPEPEDILWDKTNPDLEELRSIIGVHFNSPCRSQEPLNHGAYARVFLYTLQNDIQLVARVILPVRETIKTEAEIAAMDMARGLLIPTIIALL
jgi:hypothetical protein